MSAPAQVERGAPVEMPSSTKMISVMGLVSLICGLLIVTVYQGTMEPIRRNQESIMRDTVATLLPGVKKQVVYEVTESGDLELTEGVQISGPRIFAGYDESGALMGVVIEASERGYADLIKAMYAYSPKKQAIVGFRVVELKETPGLGDKITNDPEFLSNFEELDAKLDASGAHVVHPITAVKHGTKKNPWEIDAISGATISSRAVGRMLEKSTQEMLPVVTRNLDRLERGE